MTVCRVRGTPQALAKTTEPAMPLYDIPLFSMLRTRMQWHQERQQVLANNLANAEIPAARSRAAGV